MILNAPNTYSIPLYHANDSEKCKSFLENKDHLIAHEDRYWLGYGMYFWDNKSNAKYWAGEKIRKQEAKIVYILKATLLCKEEQILDLTDASDIQNIQKFWNTYCKIRKLDKKQSKRPLGEILDTLLRFFPKQLPFKVIKCHAYYPKSKEYEIFKKAISFFKKGTSTPDDKTKTIYVVKDNNLLSNRQKIKAVSK